MSSRPRPSSPSCVSPWRAGESGYSLVELAVAMSMMLIGGAIAFATATQARHLYDSDAARTALNQDLRSAMDMIATEVRQAGERVTPDFPALELVDAAPGDRLTARRHMVETVLLSCTDLTISDVRIFVGLPAGTGNCSIATDNDSDGYPDNLQQYREYRTEHGTGSSPTVLDIGYIFDPVTGLGEYFAFENEEVDAVTLGWFLRLNGGGLTTAYPASNQPRVYLIEETRFDLTSGTLELRRDGAVATPLAVIDGVVGFQAELLMQDSTTRTTFASGDDWTQVRSVRLELAGERTVHDRTMGRSLTAEVFPRSILSH